MENVYIKTEDLNYWIAKYFKNKDIISIDDLIGCIENLDEDNESLKIKIEELENEICEMNRKETKSLWERGE